MSQALTVYCNQENTPSTVTTTLVTQSTGDRAVVYDLAVKKTDRAAIAFGNWMRNRNTVEFLGIWQIPNNPDLGGVSLLGGLTLLGVNALRVHGQRALRVRFEKCSVRFFVGNEFSCRFLPGVIPRGRVRLYNTV